jgi:hypothetical protein
MGVSMGPADHLTRSNPDSQPLGYWEDQGFVALNRQIIKAAGGHWHRPPTRGAIIAAGLSYSADIAALIEDRDSRQRWGWKDPRNCLTIDCYQAALTGRDVRYVQIVRDRAAIAESLIRRGELLGGQTSAGGFAGLAAEHERRVSDFFTRHDPERITVHYEAMTDPDSAAGDVERLARFLGLDAGLVGEGLKRIKVKERT